MAAALLATMRGMPAHPSRVVTERTEFGETERDESNGGDSVMTGGDSVMTGGDSVMTGGLVQSEPQLVQPVVTRIDVGVPPWVMASCPAGAKSGADGAVCREGREP